MSLNNEGLNLIENFQDLTYPVKRAILFYAYDIKHQTSHFPQKIKEIAKQCPLKEGETEDNAIEKIKEEVQSWWSKFAQKEAGDGTPTVHPIHATQYQAIVDVHYTLFIPDADCDYFPQSLKKTSKVIYCTYKVSKPRNENILEGSIITLTNVHDMITGHQKLHEFILDHSVYVNEGTDLNYINDGRTKFEDTQRGHPKIFFNIVETRISKYLS